MKESKHQRKRNSKLKSIGHGEKCQGCGFSDFPQILTMHHIFPKAMGKQPELPRKLRYLILCPNCHAMINKGIRDGKTGEFK